jgi:hypothetical protein
VCAHLLGLRAEERRITRRRVEAKAQARGVRVNPALAPTTVEGSDYLQFLKEFVDDLNRRCAHLNTLIENVGEALDKEAKKVCHFS